MSDRLKQLFSEYGQSPWLDNLKRSYITSGELDRVRANGIRGLTSNPTIFQKAIQGSDEYTEQFKSLISSNTGLLDSYWELVLHDIHGALVKKTPYLYIPQRWAPHFGNHPIKSYLPVLKCSFRTWY